MFKINSLAIKCANISDNKKAPIGKNQSALYIALGVIACTPVYCDSG